MSLDGFIAGPRGDMSWLSEHVGAVAVDVDALMAEMGALLIGRRTYDGDDPNAGTDSEGAYGGRWDGRSVVLTHRPPATDTPGVTFGTDLHEAVQAAKDTADGRYVNILGADVARQCHAAVADSTRCWSSWRRCCSGTGPGSTSSRAASAFASRRCPGARATGSAS